MVMKGKDSFEFFFEGEDKSWRIRDHPDFPGWFLMEEFQEGYYSAEFYDKYENAGVEDLQGMLERLAKDPEETLEGLFGEKFEIKEVRVENDE